VGEGTSRNIVLTGFSYTGKTRVGRAVAEKLGWTYVDTDDEIVRLAGKPIPDIFGQDGEERFREYERDVLRRVCVEKEHVISTGGGAVVNATNREIMMDSGVVVCLEAQPATIYARLRKDAEENPGQEIRPLLQHPDPLKRIEYLKSVRQPYYDLCDWAVHVDNLSVEEAADEVIRGWRYGARGRPTTPVLPAASESDAPYCQEKGAACVVKTATESYPVFVGWDNLDGLGGRMRNAGLAGQAYVISDDSVFPIYGDSLVGQLKDSGFSVDSFAVPHGELSKSFDTAQRLYDWLVEQRGERGDSIVALGGGVVGDLAGFVAATFLRGIAFVQVPTSLIGMVDSSIGGKVGINHPRGKNLIGAFYQPRLVLSDVQTLDTLPARELVSGWAEVVKHAMIRDADLLELLSERAGELARLEKQMTTRVVSRSAAIKAAVVSRDEKESGLRTILNYGHTIAHGLEAATSYERFLHGEAVAIGMMGAAMISERLGMVNRTVVDAQRDILERLGLPVSFSDVSADAILRAMALDKKVRDERVRWVLLSGVGKPTIRDDVPPDLVREALGALMRS